MTQTQHSPSFVVPRSGVGGALEGRDAEQEAALARSHDVVAVVDDRVLIHAAGADVDEFLQGQLCSDLRKLTPDRAQLTGLSSPKGRLLAVMLMHRNADGVSLELPRSLAAAVLKRLRMYVLRAKVQLDMATDEPPALGVAGPAAASLLGDASLPCPPAPLDCAHGDDGTRVTRCLGEPARFLVRAAPARIDDLWRRLGEAAQPVGCAAWRLLDVLAGVPNVYPETQDRFVAQMVNLDLLGGISFDKGCYTGQEVVARLHYLGNLKRRMFLLDARSSATVPGTPIHDADDGGKHVGDVVDAAAAADGHTAIAAVLQLSHARSEALRLGGPEGPALSEPRPFAPGLPPT